MSIENVNLLHPQDSYLAQMNIALMKAPIEDPVMTEFAAALNKVNAIADQSPGFIWRLQTSSGNAADIRAYADPRILVNLSVWQSVEHLKAYVYKSLHGDFFVRRRQWFEKWQGEHLGMWWIPAGHTPTVEEGKAKLEYLALHNNSAECFTVAKPYPPPTAAQELWLNPAETLSEQRVGYDETSCSNEATLLELEHRSGWGNSDCLHYGVEQWLKLELRG